MLSSIVGGSRLSARWRRLVALPIVAVVAAGGLTVERPAAAAPADPGFPKPSVPAALKLSNPRPAPAVKQRAPYAKFEPRKRATLPGAQRVTVSLAAANKTDGRAAERWIRAGSLPIALSGAGASPHQVQVTTADQGVAKAAGVRGMLFSLRSGAGAGMVGVDVDEAGFRHAFGGDYAARLRLVQLPACALTTPHVQQCQTRTPVRGEAGAPLTAQVPVPAGAEGEIVLAAASDADGSAGDYTATSLSPGGSWSVGGNTGSFSYNYPIAVPPAIGGVGPTIGLAYDSASQDARTVGTNSQSSWIGDGWSSTENYVERTYRPCDEVNGSGAPQGSGDLCWGGQILTLSLNGRSSAVVYDDDSRTFRLADDSATMKIEQLTGANNDTRNREYFRVTEDGVQYYFGLNRLPGWSADHDETESAWTVPVYKAHAGVSDCPDGAFAATACELGYRFNLDYVVDLHSNAMAYYYKAEVGHYGANAKNNAVPYTRSGHLLRIDYGMTASTIFSGTAPAQVEFKPEERCLRGLPAGNRCGDDQFTEANPEYWPDVPIDLNCTSSSTNCVMHSPSFWSRTRLISITTKIQAAGRTALVDRYDLEHTFPDGGDHAPTLWLESIKRTGLSRLGGATADADTPAVTFYPVQLANRVRSDLPRMFHGRIQNIVSEFGAETTVEYTTPSCPGLPASDPADADDSRAQQFAATNETGCFPVYWTPEAQPRPLIDWFYTHPVRSVSTIDRYNRYQDGSQPALVTRYAYKGKPGWHYDDNEVVKKKYRTWGQFRGYPEVHVITGDTANFHFTDGSPTYDQKTLTKTFYFLGMNGDTLPGGRSRNVPPLTSQDDMVTVADHNGYAGREFETLTFTGVDGTVDSATVTVPTIIGPTATRDRSGLPPLTAQMVRTAKSLTRQAVSYGWRRTETNTFYNTALGQSTTGMPVQVADRGEIGATGNKTKCTFTRYLDGASATLVVKAEEITTDQDCAGSGAEPAGALISDLRTSYDGNSFARNGDGQAAPVRPTRGNATLVQQASTATGATAGTFVDMAATSYDSYGRITAVTRTPRSKAGNGTTSIAQSTYTRYTPSSGEVPSRVETVTQVTPGTNCAAATTSTKDCHIASVAMEQARQQPITKTDVAAMKSSLTYDALGRVTAVWLPNKNKAAGAEANILYGYRLSATAPSVVTTRTLLDKAQIDSPPTYATSKVLYDAMLRPLETQDVGENGMTIVSDTQYDTHGRTVHTNNAYAVSGQPADRLFSDQLSQVSIPSSTVTDYDAMGRPTQVTEQHNNRAAWRTRTAYTGDSTTVLPPTGGISATETTNARDQLTRLRHYTTLPTVSGDKYAGFSVGGGAGQDITYQHDAAGRQVSTTGPNGAVWEDQYDLFGRITSHLDPDTGTSLTWYDDASNVTATRDGRGSRLDFTYDLLGRKLTATHWTLTFKYASWTYDTLRIGKPTSATRYVPNVTGDYTVAVTGYSTLGNPLGRKITLPGVEHPLPASYQTKYTYTPNTELLSSQNEPTVGRLLGETIDYSHTALGAPTRTFGTQAYVTDTIYTNFGKPSLVKMGASTNQAQINYEYEPHTLRLKQRTLSRSQGIGPVVDQTAYTYDQAGNALSATNRQSETGNTVVDSQCYRYNTLARLTQAWTAKGDCPGATTVQPDPTSLSSGPGSYWQSFTYDTVGNRTRMVEHSTTGGADNTTEYTHGCTENCNPRYGPQPDTLTATTGGPLPTKFRYNGAGQMLSRTPTDGVSAGQGLEWDNEGNLAKVTTTGAAPTDTSYLYDADGNQLIRRETGRTTLFAGDTQIVIDTTAKPAVLLGASRAVRHGGAGPAIAMTSTLPGGSSNYLLNDPHGTAGLAMNVSTQALSRQQFKPYGEPRASANLTLWPDSTRGYLGAPKNAHTGYTDLGARKYDPALGRFISADPVLQTTNPNELGGYTYAGDNPITLSDPDGLWGKDPELDYNTGQAKPGTGAKPPTKVNSPSSGHHAGTQGGSSGGDREVTKERERRKQVFLGVTKPESPACQGPGFAGLCVSMRNQVNNNGYDPVQAWIDINCASGWGESACRKDLGYKWNCGNAACPELMIHATEMLGVATAGIEAGASMGIGSIAKNACSFSGDTEVLMSDGTTKPIDQVEVGDEVFAADPETGEGGSRKVVATYPHEDDLINLKLSSGTLTTTEDHPFWNVTDRRWERADTLDRGDRLATPTGVAVTEGFDWATSRRGSAFDLTVDHLHTYYVVAGSAAVLVHNCGKGVVKYDSTLAMRNLTIGRLAKASELDRFGSAQQGWVRSRTPGGPIQYKDGNGTLRLTIKRGSDRAAGSNFPHVEMRDALGQRIDPYGYPVTRKSAGNHTPIEYDLP